MKSRMLRLWLLAFLLSLAGCASNTSKTIVPFADLRAQTELKGRIVFDVPPENIYKIGRDHIRIVSEDEMTNFTKQVDEKTRDQPAFHEHGSFNVRQLADIKALEEVTTDEEGNFSHTLPANGRVALVVEIKRRFKGEDGPSGKYYWMVWVTLENQKSVSVILNSDDCLQWHPMFETSNLKYIKSL